MPGVRERAAPPTALPSIFGYPHFRDAAILHRESESARSVEAVAADIDQHARLIAMLFARAERKPCLHADELAVGPAPDLFPSTINGAPVIDDAALLEEIEQGIGVAAVDRVNEGGDDRRGGHPGNLSQLRRWMNARPQAIRQGPQPWWPCRRSIQTGVAGVTAPRSPRICGKKSPQSLVTVTSKQGCPRDGVRGRGCGVS